MVFYLYNTRDDSSTQAQQFIRYINAMDFEK